VTLLVNILHATYGQDFVPKQACPRVQHRTSSRSGQNPA
jgi:hypothetical protein